MDSYMQKKLYFPEFHEILSDYLRDNKMTQCEFARKAGLKPNLVSKWIQGSARPSYDNLKKISLALDVSVNYLLGISGTY